MTINKALSVLLLMLVALFNLSSPATASVTGVEKGGQKKPKHEQYKAVNEFCVQRRSRREREFCLRVLKYDPRSATAKTNEDLLFISVDLAIYKTNRNIQFLQSTFSNYDNKTNTTDDIPSNPARQPPPPPLKTALKECISSYDWGTGELKIIPTKFKDDPRIVRYDALMARDGLQNCQESLDRNNITELPILRRQRSATAFVKLVVDISMTF